MVLDRIQKVLLFLRPTHIHRFYSTRIPSLRKRYAEENSRRLEKAGGDGMDGCHLATQFLWGAG